MLSRAISSAAKAGRKYVLTGADGNLGCIAAEHALKIQKPGDQLVFTSYQLEAIPNETIKRWESKGATVVAATYDDEDQLKRIFEGAEAVAFISTWLFGEGRRNQARNVCNAAKAVGVDRVCYTSFVGAGSDAASEEEIPFLPRDHHAIEQIIYASGLNYNIQRNYLYQDNIPWLFAPSWKFCGDKWLTNTHGVPGAYVAREDCGNVQAALLLGKGEPNKVYEVTGPEAVTNEEIFHWMCDQTGYKAQYVDMPDEQLEKWWKEKDLPMSVYEGTFDHLPMKLCMGDLLCCGEMLANGHMRQTTDTVEKLTGRKPLGFRYNLLNYLDLFPRP